MASSSSSSPLALAFSSQSWKYDVFLSFRGEDTRKNFVDHLYKALVQQGIDTYKDDKTLRRGDSINPSLMKAIQESQIAIIIFSENYADSSWCLDELAHILKCKDMIGQIVMPIFYNVDPSEVRKQKRKYGDAFTKHELENKNKVETWRKALVEASNLAGWEPKNIANGHESKVIEEIVGNILSRLQQVTSSANENLIGVAARVQRLRSDLQIGSDGVRMVGIWGVGGGGKTTLASCVYDEISCKFEGCCFLENVREESSRHGLGKLKDDILSKMEANNIGGGRNLIDKRFRHRKVLIVLDDVDRLDQLKVLAGSPDWFGNGSRIIITTRDEHLLKAHKVVVHNISLLNGDEAIELFRKQAPWDYKHKKDGRMEDYKRLSEEVVSYAGGLPLALTVLGSFLCDKNIQQWKSALARLKEIPDNDILEKLKLSFDGLTKVQKDLFLDIACFYRWEEKDTAMEMLNACGFHPVIGVEELRQKALITIWHERFNMHDLVQEMGHYIVRGEHPNNPEKHSRVWKDEDVLKICAVDATKELDKIEAIQVDKHSFPEQNPSPIVANMSNLQYIDWRGDPANPLLDNFPPRELCCLVLREGLQKQLWNGNKELDKIEAIEVDQDWFPGQNLSPIVANMKNLRYIDWKGGNQLLDNFQPRELCCPVLYGGLQKQLWNGYKYLPNLKKMELWDLGSLIMTPKFDGLPNLERFKLLGCRKLEEIHSSFGRLEMLVYLYISACPSIKKFPPVARLKKLEVIELRGCHGVFELSKIQQKMENLGDEDDSGEREVNISREDLIDVHNNINRIWLPNLRELTLTECNLGDECMSSAVWELPNLQQLNLSVNNFSRLSLLRIPRLKWLNVSHCYSLVELSELLSSIAVVIADWCTSLKTFGDVSNCKWLWNVLLLRVEKVGPPVGDMLLDSMLRRNAFEHHHLSMTLQHQMISNRFVGKLSRGGKFPLRLPDDWYNDFCGLLIQVVAYDNLSAIEIIMKQEVDIGPPFELWQKEDYKHEATRTCVGYVSFSSLRRTACFNSTYNAISFSLHPFRSGPWERLGFALVPKRRKDDLVQTTQFITDSEFWDEEIDYGQTFKIHQDSNSSTNILWRPDCVIPRVISRS